jgi:phage terminase large subunit GpA-like protein
MRPRPRAKSLAKERLAHSAYKRIIELSNPSLPDLGIDEAYHNSDQRHWTLKCPACGRWVSLEREFPLKLVPLPEILVQLAG